MQSNKVKINKKCLVCGKPSIVWLNGLFGLCGDCGLRLTMFALNCGIPVINTCKGIPKELLMPRRFSNN